METSPGGGFRLPSYRSGNVTARSVPPALSVSPSQLALQKAALLRQSLQAKSARENVSAKLQEDEGKPEGDSHLQVYENIPKGLNPKEYQEWAQEWLPRLASRKGGVRDPGGLALGHVPSLVRRGSQDKNSPPENISGPLVYHFNPGSGREPRAEYLDMYMEYKTKRAQSAKLPRSKRYTGPTARKQNPEEPKWEFLKPDEEPREVNGAKLEIPAWQANKDTPDTAELNKFLDSVRDKTYFSFCQKTVEKERDRARTPRSHKSKSAGVKLDRVGLRRNKLGILEPPQKLPLRKGSLRHGHSFDINHQRINEFQPPPPPNLGEAIVPIKSTRGDRVFLTEEDNDGSPEPGRPRDPRKGTLIRNPTHKLVTRIPTESAGEEPLSRPDDVTMETDMGKEDATSGTFGFVLNGHKLGKEAADQNDIRNGEDPRDFNGLDEILNNNSVGTQEDIESTNNTRITPAKTRKLVIRFDKKDKDKIESIRTVTSERLTIHK